MADDHEDPSRDGVPNLLKYSLNLAPLSSVQLPIVQGQLKGGSSELSFTRVPAAFDIQYVTEASADLLEWKTTDLAETAAIALPDGTERVTVRNSAALSSKGFLRLRVVRAAADSDKDALDDDWELRYFGNLAESGDEDFDGDGVANAAEQLAGTDPQDYYDGEPRPPDADAEAYFAAVGIEDALMRARIHEWISGLKRLGLYSNAVSMITLASGQNSNKLRAIKGPAPTLIGAPQRDLEGVHFSGLGTEYVSFANPIRTPELENLSIFAAFRSKQKTNSLVVGSFIWGQLGPSLIAGGSPFAGADPNDLFFDATTDGVAHVMPTGGPGQRTYAVGNTGLVQTACATLSPSNISIQAGFDRRHEALGTFKPVWNDNAEWRIGLGNSGAYSFEGTIAFVAIFNTALSDSQYQAVRWLYRNTLGAHLQWPLNAVMEGDSLTGESNGSEWTRQLRSLSNWKGKFAKRNVATDGEAIDQMLAQFPTQVKLVAREPGRKYLFIWAGRNGLANRSPELLASLQKYWSVARNAGFKVAAFTVLPSIYDDELTSEFRNALNESIRNDRTKYDYLIDIASIPSLSAPSDTRYYLLDGVHLNSTGQRLVAELVNAVIADP